MQPTMTTLNPNAVTTDIIQQYLDENKQLILTILENQNAGKLSECAENQARLQHNLMYLAAIADSQPQPPTMHAQYPSSSLMQAGGGRFLPHQQMQAMTPQALMAARSSMLYAQPPLSLLQQQGQQGSLHGQLGFGPGGGSGLHMLHSESSLGGSSSGGLSAGGFPDYGRGEGMQSASRGLSGAGKGEVGSSDGGRSGQSGDGGQPLYLKGSGDERN